MSKQKINMKIQIIKGLSLVLFLCLFCSGIKAQPTSVVYTTAGTYNWVCPAGVTAIDIELWGAGGGGGGTPNTNGSGAGGGGGGAYAKRFKVPVTPGNSYQIIVGAGGAGGNGANTPTSGSKGGDSRATFGSIVIIAGGGDGGIRGSNGAGGTGGTASGGHINYSGGNGAAGVNGSYGGGGGGGAGSLGAGKNASGGTGGAATSDYGGAGGNGGNPPVVGSNYGGGGGGGYGNRISGRAGAGGRGAIFYHRPEITQNPTNQSICINSSADFIIQATGAGILTYQWKYQGQNVTNGVPAGAIYSGANTPTLTVSGNIATGTYSGYYCVVSNEYGFVSSNTADLIIGTDVAPEPPYNLSVTPALACSGVERTLSAQSSTGVLQWYSGTCSGTLVGETIYPAQTSVYYAKVYDSSTGCYSFCSELTVNVYDNMQVISQPQSTYACAGVPVSFSIIGTGSGITYQWQVNQGSGFADIVNGGVYNGAQSATLTISDPAGIDGYQFRCVISGLCDFTISDAATLNVLSSGLSGTKTVGSGGDYPTLKAAFDAINANGLSGDLYLAIISDIIETSQAVLNQWVDCAGNSNYSVTIYPSGSARTISGNFGNFLVILNGADHVTIDGRIDMTGDPNSLIFSNTYVNGTPLLLLNDACYNTIRYSTFRGALYGISFGAAIETGNDFNIIEYCDVRESLPTLYIGILATGTAGKENNDNIIRYCNIYNFYDAGYICRGIQIQSGNTRWKIIGNSLYQTANRTDASFWGIVISNSSGGEFVVEGNFIGGQAPQCGGNKMSYSSSIYGITFEGIIMQINSTGVSIVKNNVFKNINFTSLPITSYSQLAIFTPIDIWGGRVDVIDNIIGDDATGSINVTVNDYSTKTAWNNGIYHAGEGNIIGNRIGSITFSGTINDQCGFNAIEYVGTTITDQIIANNVIGHETTSNSISFASGTTPAMTMGGIYFGTSGNFLTSVTNNTISNINIGTSTSSCFFIGLNNQATAGSQIINGNKIYNITTASARTGSFSTPTDFPAFVGIRTNNTSANSNIYISNNTIQSIHSTNTTAGYKLYGVFADVATSGTHLIDRNFIHTITSSNASEFVWIEGIWVKSGTVSVVNNMIRLGVGGINTNNFIAGIEIQTTSANNVIFNSVFVGGTSTGTRSTTGFLRSAASGNSNVRNNIFVNARSGGGAIHYAYYSNSITGLTSNYNIYSNNSGGVNAYLNGGNRTTLAQIQAATGQDQNSLVNIPLFVNPTGSGTDCNLHIQLGSPAIGAGVSGTGITVDYDNQARDIPPCIGADENVIPPHATNVYGIYSPDGINGNITDCEIISEGGVPGGIGYNLAAPNEEFYPNVYVSAYPVLTVSNVSCTNSDIIYTTDSPAANWLLGNGANPSSSTETPVLVQYESVGEKTIIESVKVYTNFLNITMEAPDPGVILGAPTGTGCPTTYTYTSSVAGSAGYSYEWNVYPPSGTQAIVHNANSAVSDITFINQTYVDQVFLVTLDIETECCGKLRRVERYITIYPGPDLPVVDGGPFNICTGGAQEVSLLYPNPEYSYEWFDAEIEGNQIASGTSNVFNSIPSGDNYYYVQSTNSFGCSSPRVEIQITGIDADPPVVSDASTCGENDVTLSIDSPQPGFVYIWREGSCNGTVLQSGYSPFFTYNISETTTFYVSVVPPGCDTSTCSTPTVTYYSSPETIVWEGDDIANPNDWFTAENWLNGCIPTCATDVLIPGTVSNFPEIDYHPFMNAETKNITLESGSSLIFVDNKAMLYVCGDFNHAGSLIANDIGTVEFRGNSVQTYINNAGTGSFNNVKINNTSIGISISGGDFNIGSKGNLIFVDGVIMTGSNKLVVQNSNSNAITGYNKNSYIIGNLRRYINESEVLYAFPVGTSDRYALAELYNNSLSSVTYLDAKFTTSFSSIGDLDPAKAFDGETRYNYISSEGIWQINPNQAPGSGSYDIKLWFNDGGYGTFANLSDGKFAPLKRLTGSTSAEDWTAEGGIHIPTTVGSGYAHRTGWTSFSDYGVGYEFNPLPVELSNFEAICENNEILIYWSTVSEINNHYFMLEYSFDLKNFTEITRIYGAGSSNAVNNYSYKYTLNSNKKIYLRLKQIDYDNKTNILGIINVLCNDNFDNPGIYLYPNPFHNEVYVVAENIKEDILFLELYDGIGKMVLSKSYKIEDNKLGTYLNLEFLTPAVYHVKIFGKNFVHNEKLIKKQ